MRGGSDILPDENIPCNMFDALMDSRKCFDGVRKSLLQARDGSKWSLSLQIIIDDILKNFCDPALVADPKIKDFQGAIAIVAANHSIPIQVPPNFMEEIWGFYTKAFLEGAQNCSYWLSYDELLALATIAGVKLLVLEEGEGE